MYITAQGPVSEMTYTESSGTLNSSIPYHSVAEDQEVTAGLGESNVSLAPGL